MKQNKLFQLWSYMTAKKIGNNSKSKIEELPEITIAPTTDEKTLCPIRIKEIHDLVTEMIILGVKRGRPSRYEEELKNVA